VGEAADGNGDDKLKKLVIFDLDGTILDTLEDLCDATNYALGCFGFGARTLDEVRRFVGNGIGKLIERAVPDGTDEKTTEAVLATFKEYYGEHCEDKTAAYDGVMEMLEELRAAGIKTAVVSNKADFAVQKLCEKYFDGMFDVCVGERSGVPRKPAPDSVYGILNELGVAACDAVYVGDSDVDIATARNAGLDEILVSWGFRGREFLLEHGAKVVVDEPVGIVARVGLVPKSFWR
jgi:phosphoglycolate phosphatase